ncbi:HAD-IA family hydrolase [Gilvimarinus sp. DA14]|uniref:HAD-IA family hydrolase n=1 Tax=Gilvimarinus sp. DA14 TaxID=2956798 RepID=UPI0020B6EB77|nr:HAD-IA family hydrolase [Gilvimarinus sp. DA14]UTF60546.1 HAD-IA family hydrolase [Gilvimarinus sp. DA14]
MLYIFDWDGTLSDSTDTIVAAMQRAAEDIGWQRPEDDTVRNIIGLGLPEALRVMYPDESVQSLDAIRDRYRHHYLQMDQAKPAELYPRVQESLDKLRADGHILAVATGKSRKGLDRIFAAMGLDGYFHASRCADETASKPDPLMLHQLLAELSVPAAEAVMVGDTEYDMEMGRRAGMARIAVSYGAHKPERLYPYEPELCMSCFSEILSWRR